jgi:hypothetical protein
MVSFSNTGCWHEAMTANLRISIKDYYRVKSRLQINGHYGQAAA